MDSWAQVIYLGKKASKHVTFKTKPPFRWHNNCKRCSGGARVVFCSSFFLWRHSCSKSQSTTYVIQCRRSRSSLIWCPQSRVQNWNHQSSKNQIVNGVLDERFFNSNNLNKFQTLSCSTWKHSCSRSQWYICGQGKEWKTARVTKWQQFAFINLSNTQIHTELLDTLDGYTMHVHMEPKYLLIQNQTRSWARGKITSLKLVFLKFTSPIFPEMITP